MHTKKDQPSASKSVCGTRPFVLWICDRSSEHGGIACSLYDIYPALSRAGARIEFVAPIDADFPVLESQGAVIHKVLPTMASKKGYVWSLLACAPLVRLFHSLGPSVILADHTNGLWLVLLLRGLRLRFRAVYRNHGVGYLANRERLARLIANGVDTTITVAQTELETFNGLTGNPALARFVPNCLPAHCLSDRWRSRPMNTSGGPRIAYVGWLSEAKGIYKFITLMGRIREQLPLARGIAMGRILPEERSKDLPGLMKAASIDYLGAVQRDLIFEDVDILVVCSRRESFGLTTIEAPFFNVVPIAFDSPGTRFLLSNEPECLVAGEDLDKMLSSILFLWDNPDRRSTICKALRESYKTNFHPDRLSIELMNAIAEGGCGGARHLSAPPTL